MIIENKIPNHWKIMKLEDLCEKMSNGANVKQQDERIGFPISRIETIWNETIDINRVKYIAEDSVEFKDKYALKKDDILFSHINSDLHLGKTAIYKNHPVVLIHGINILLIRVNQKVSADFINYQLKLKRCRGEFIDIAQKSVNQSSINQSKLKNLEIVVPPLHEQLLIVSKLEELLSDLENGKKLLETAQQQLKIYKQCLLNQLVNGEPSNTLESVIEKLDQGWSPKCHNEPSTNVKEWAVIKTTAVQSGYFRDNENKRLPENLTPRKQHELKKGDLLITRAGPRIRVGICCMVRKTRPYLLNCDKVYRMRINPKIATPEYVELILNSPKYASEIEKMKTGISDSGVNLTQKGFVKMLIPIPTLKEQQRIVAETESKLTVCDKIEETITNSLQQTEMLKQSILKKAFEGKLIN